MKEVQIVTAFFDIGRGNIKNFERDNSKYIEYFKFWARIKNKVVVYTDSETAKAVEKIRAEFGLKEQTKIVTIDHIFLLDQELYDLMVGAHSNKISVNFRKYPNNPEAWNAKYNYIMYLKPYIVSDAIKRGLVDGTVAWVDFGYNHGGEILMHADDFSFLWRYDFSPKIHAFALEKLDDTPIFEIVRSMRVFIVGSLLIAPAHLWKELMVLYRESMLHLTRCGFPDDDQTLLVMAYRERPQMFELHEVEDFFSGIKQVGGGHFAVRPQKQYKESKKQAKIRWKEQRYLEAAKYFIKYIGEKQQRR